MATIQLIPQSPFVQGQPATFLLRTDFGASALGTAILSLTLPGTGLENIAITPLGFTPPADTFDVTLPASPLSPAEVQCHRGSASAGSEDLLQIDATITGDRSVSYFLRAAVVDALDVNGAPLELPSTELEIVVEAGLPAVVTTDLDRGFAGVAYRDVLRAQGGQPPYSWTIVTGALPQGIALGADGIFSGLSASPASAVLGVRATDAAGVSAQASLTLVIRHAPLVITSSELPPAAPGRSYSQTLIATGGKAPIQWTVDGLPPGMSVQNGRITGSPHADPPPFDRWPLVLHATDADVPPQTATAAASLDVLPALPREHLSVSSPGAILVGRDLCWIEYQVTAHASSERLGTLVDYGAELDRERDELIAGIAEVAAETLEERDPGLVRGHHESLGRLIDVYRDLDAQRKTGERVTIEAHVTVDDQPVATANAGGQRTLQELRAIADHPRIPYDVPRSARGMAVRAAFARGGRRLREWSRGVLDAAFDDYAANGSRAARSDGRRYLSGSGIGGFGFGTDNVFESLTSIIPSLEDFGFDIGRWFGDLIPKPGIVKLTPGAHRVTVRWSSGRAIGIGPIAVVPTSRQDIVRFGVTFQPLHVPAGPRFASPTSFGGTNLGSPGERSYDAILSASGTDIVVSSDDGLQLFIDTGKAGQRYHGAVAYPVQPGFVPERLTTTVLDLYGRSSIIATSASKAAFILNQGPAGPQLVTPSLTLSAAERVGAAVAGATEPSLWRTIQLTLGSRLATFGGLASVRTTGVLAAPSFTPLLSGITFDVASCVALLEEDGQPTRLAVGFDAGGQVAIVGQPFAFVPPGRYQQPIDMLRGNLSGGGSELAVALRQGKSVRLFRWQSGAWQSLTAVDLPVRPWEITIGPTDAHSVAIASKHEGALLLLVWTDPDQQPKLMTLTSGKPGLRISGEAGVLAATDPAAGEVVVYR